MNHFTRNLPSNQTIGSNPTPASLRISSQNNKAKWNRTTSLLFSSLNSSIALEHSLILGLGKCEYKETQMSDMWYSI